MYRKDIDKFLATCIHSDISFAASFLAQWNHASIKIVDILVKI